MKQQNTQPAPALANAIQITPQNKIFQLNKQLILTCRKLETGPLENYTHMATLIHKVNLLLLEYDSVADLKNISSIIYTDKLLNTLIDFCMNTENFANFGIRLIEILSLEFTNKIAKSEIFSVIMGLLRTNDYETVAQCLSFLSVMTQQISAKESEQRVQITEHVNNLYLAKILNPKLLSLVLATVSKQPESPQIEFIHYALEIVNICILNKELRDHILVSELPSLVRMSKSVNAEGEVQINADQKTNWTEYLRMLEKNDQIKSIKKMRQKVTRMRKELEFWQKSKEPKTEESKEEVQEKE